MSSEKPRPDVIDTNLVVEQAFGPEPGTRRMTRQRADTFVMWRRR
jgi:hypothetical protein